MVLEPPSPKPSGDGEFADAIREIAALLWHNPHGPAPEAPPRPPGRPFLRVVAGTDLLNANSTEG